MPWLLRDGRVLATSRWRPPATERRRGLLGRDGIEGALLIERARSVHTIGMRFPIDVAHLDAEGVVLRITDDAAATARAARCSAPVACSRPRPGASGTGSWRRARCSRSTTADRRAGSRPVSGTALVVVGTPIGNLGDLAPRAVDALAAADVIACEDTRRTGRLLAAAGVERTDLVVVNDHTEQRASADAGRDGCRQARRWRW